MNPWYCGWTKSCTTLKPWETTVCWYLQRNHHSRVSYVVQDFVHPQYESFAVRQGFQTTTGSMNQYSSPLAPDRFSVRDLQPTCQRAFGEMSSSPPPPPPPPGIIGQQALNLLSIFFPGIVLDAMLAEDEPRPTTVMMRSLVSE